MNMTGTEHASQTPRLLASRSSVPVPIFTIAYHKNCSVHLIMTDTILTPSPVAGNRQQASSCRSEFRCEANCGENEKWKCVTLLLLALLPSRTLIGDNKLAARRCCCCSRCAMKIIAALRVVERKRERERRQRRLYGGSYRMRSFIIVH